MERKLTTIAVIQFGAFELDIARFELRKAGTRIAVEPQAHLNKIATQLNERPRKTLQFETPADRFKQCVAATG